MLLCEYLLWEVVAQRHVSESNVNVVLDYLWSRSSFYLIFKLSLKS